MPRSSQKCAGRSLLAVMLLAGLAVGFVSGCAQPNTPNEVEPLNIEDLPKASGGSEEVEKRPQESIENLLKGRVSGVNVTMNRDGSLNIRIRGVTSYLGSNEPLYVLDGIPIRVEPGGTVGGITPYNIESIRVLKGPPETTLYGVRGANGVILIRTKHSG
ncbi:MAG: TonB-dependent receptor plug domain-containing protein [Gemmatimonadota bacterium]|nr:MAG: TonB-dependent receptor plug domain-containing protein [Gemmatimonadota bacterium]